jgi:SAM-dependent methyltransferase
MPEYNKYYQKRDYFGKPYPELLDYMDRFERTNKIVDLGCGQGRDVLALGRMGFPVMGIDISEVGINQLNEVGRKENLPVSTTVMSYKTFGDISDFDFVLMNSMFHFYKNDVDQETKALYYVLSEMKSSSRLILFIQESKSRINLLRNILIDMKIDIFIELETSIIYNEFNSKFSFLVIQKR